MPSSPARADVLRPDRQPGLPGRWQPAPPAPPRLSSGTLLLIAVALLLATCAPKPSPPGDGGIEEPPLEAEEVGAPRDAAYDPSTDPQETRRATSRLGVLPGDYPAGLPVPPEASLVDYGDRDDGARFVELHAIGRLEAVRSALEGAWRSAGWERRDETFAKDGQTAELTTEALSSTLTRVEIVWRNAP